MLQPVHLSDSLGELNYCHVVAVVNIFQQLVYLLFHLSNSSLHCRNTNVEFRFSYTLSLELKLYSVRVGWMDVSISGDL